MPSQFTILSQQCLNKFRNDPTYASNTGDVMRTLSGVVGERIRYKTTIEVYQFAEASVSNVFTYVDSTTITRSSGSFLTDDFYVGTRMVSTGVWSIGGSLSFVFDITSISNDGREMRITYFSGTAPTNGETTQDNIIAINNASTTITAAKIKFGIIENNDNFSNLSLLNQESQEYYLAGVSLSPQNMLSSGTPNSWVTGSMTINHVAGAVHPTKANYEIVHDFIINSYRDGEKSNISNLISPIELIDGNSLKLAYEFEFGQQLNDPNSFFSDDIQNNNGSVGWYNESMNGFDNDYLIDSVSYTEVSSGDNVTGVISGSKTKVTITVSRVDLVAMSSDEDLMGFAFKFAAPESEYTNTATDFVTNLMFSDSYQEDGGTVTPNFNGVITSHVVTLSAGTLISEVEIELTGTQQLRLNEESQFLISAIVGNKTLSNGASNRVSLLVDFGTFIISDGLTGLVGIDQFNFIQIGQTYGVDPGSPSLNAWNEDPITTNIDFWLDLNLDSVLTSLSFKLVAYNSIKDDFFILDNFNFDLSSSLIVGGIQEIAVNQTRGYTNAFESQFNDCIISIGALVGTKQHYNIQFSQRIKWQDWILNESVDLDFFDNTKLNNNLNYKSSNYSDLLDYDIYLMASGSATGTDILGSSGVGLFEILSGKISTFDYGEDSNTPLTEEWTDSSIKTLIGGVDSNLSLSSDSETEIEAEFFNTALTLVSGDLVNITVLHKWQPVNSVSDDIIEQEADISLITGNKIKSTSTIPPSTIVSGLTYEISTRIQKIL